MSVQDGQCEQCDQARCICAPPGLIPGTLVRIAWRACGMRCERSPMPAEDATEKVEWLNRFYSGKVHHFLTIEPIRDA